MKSLRVELAGRGYEILIAEGLIGNAARHIAPLLSQKRVIIITDENVGKIYLQPLTKSLEAGGIKTESIIVAAGEKTKSFAVLEKLSEEILSKNIDRKTTLLALGGGVIGDLTGFAASILLRGIDFIQLPTTLLAMVDSSVGGKTGINTRQGKNLVGSFYQPKLVLADISALESLNEREFLSGFAEVIKYGLINDREFFEWLNRNLNKILARDRSSIIHAIFKSCTAKAEIVAKDEREQDIRALLNLGHTFAHALELAVNFSGKLLHGEAVAIGMVLAFRFSAKSGLCSIEAAKVVEEFIAKTGLPNSLAQVEAELSAESLVNDMKKDKKAEGGKLNLILAKSIGDCFVAKDVAEMEVLEFLRGELE